MDKHRVYFSILCLAFVAQVSAQFGDCLFQHELQQPTELIHEVKLPPTAFAKINGDAFNFRVYGVTPSSDTLEMPWAYPEFAQRSAPLSLKQLNSGTTPEGKRFTYQSTSSEPIHSLELNLSNRDFEGLVTLEGADKLGDWQTVLSDCRILDLSSNGGPYRFTTLKFKSSVYRYYRITVKGIKDLRLNQVRHGVQPSFQYDTLQFEGYFQALPRLEGFPKTSVYKLNLTEDVLIDHLSFSVADTLRYVRNVEVQILLDSFQQADEMKYRYRTVGSGSLSSLDPNQPIGFTATATHHFRILIHNHDNEPLNIQDVTAGVQEPRINVRLNGAEHYYLAYGCESLKRPQYDITQELASLSDRPPALALAQLNSFVVSDPMDSAKGLFENPLWLYGALVLVALLLGWMAIGMMKK